MQTTVFSFVDASVDLTSFFNSGSWFQSCYFFWHFVFFPLSILWKAGYDDGKGCLFLFVFLFFIQVSDVFQIWQMLRCPAAWGFA